VYGLLILGRDTTWADDVWEAVEVRAEAVLQAPVLERLERLPPVTERRPVVVLYLGDMAAAADATIQEVLDEARMQAFGVLPVVHGLTHARRDVPELLHRLNAMSWDEDKDRVVEAVLIQLGIAERERKLFLSYRRQETSALALQLRRELADRSYDVFLDRFSVPPGEDFQRRLDIELADKAFVLLLESEAATGSPWVEHEVTYALSHRLAMLALTLPDAQPGARFVAIDDAFRTVLEDEDLTGRTGDVDRQLTPAALAEILREVELRHASQMRARRRNLLGSVEEWLDRDGRAYRPVADWALASIDHRGTEQVWLITPRAPVPADLREVDLLRRRIGDRSQGVVIHETPVLDPSHQALIDWITDHRPLDTTHLQAVPDLLGP
jgi:hypothetical protein